MIETAILGTIGKRISGVVVQHNDFIPTTQIHLCFDDSTSFEIYAQRSKFLELRDFTGVPSLPCIVMGTGSGQGALTDLETTERSSNPVYWKMLEIRLGNSDEDSKPRGLDALEHLNGEVVSGALAMDHMTPAICLFFESGRYLAIHDEQQNVFGSDGLDRGDLPSRHPEKKSIFLFSSGCFDPTDSF